MKREKVIEAIRGLPSEFEAEELIKKIIFIDKVEKGLLQAKKKNSFA
ncbi:MAG: hypothetical protein N2044_09775 [Cyclobacteriaceae bacterium]|nr:hypothetical protein [Cyclobacteriaceae bacterium]MCX7638118.1 hypothetical protein [Cyclobacteriaceae bacterium]MDW8331088.1 hypothetical protein [Cyclobacteriaceae bacterium]